MSDYVVVIVDGQEYKVPAPVSEALDRAKMDAALMDHVQQKIVNPISLAALGALMRGDQSINVWKNDIRDLLHAMTEVYHQVRNRPLAHSKQEGPDDV